MYQILSGFKWKQEYIHPFSPRNKQYSKNNNWKSWLCWLSFSSRIPPDSSTAVSSLAVNATPQSISLEGYTRANTSSVEQKKESYNVSEYQPRTRGARSCLGCPDHGYDASRVVVIVPGYTVRCQKRVRGFPMRVLSYPGTQRETPEASRSPDVTSWTVNFV